MNCEQVIKTICSLLSHFFLLLAGRFGKDHIFTEEDWSSLEGSSPYEKSKHLVEKAAWELVKDVPGYQQTYSTQSNSIYVRIHVLRRRNLAIRAFSWGVKRGGWGSGGVANER